MANDYTDSFAGEPYFIKKGEQLSAAGMTVALNTKEKVANKTDAIDKSNSSSAAQYPSVKAVYDLTVHKDGAQTITGVKTFGTANEAAEPALGMAKTDDAVNDGTKFATEAQVYKAQSSLSTLSFFPQGSILMMDGNWQDGRGGWYICDGRPTPYGYTPNLLNRFIMGSTGAGSSGGNNSLKLSTSNMPSHSHTFTGNAVDGHLQLSKSSEGILNKTGVFSSSSYGVQADSSHGGGSYGGWTDIYFWMQPSGSISSEGSGTAFDNRPSYYAMIYIKKMA